MAWTLLVAGCGGDGDGGGTGITPDCTLFTPAASSPYVLPWHVGQTWRANPHLRRPEELPITFTAR